MNKPNFLIVGVDSMMGAALFEKLEKSGASVYGTSQRRTPYRSSSIFYLNLSEDPASWCFPDIHFDVAYLCVGLSKMAYCQDNPAQTQKINVEAMTTLARDLSNKGTFLVYPSTNQVFSGKEPYVQPGSPCHPQNEYGRQKVAVENFISTHCKASVIVRFTKVLAPCKLGQIAPKTLLEEWIDKLTAYQQIEAFSDMTIAPVALSQAIAVLLKLGESKQVGCFHVSGAKDVSYYELASYLAMLIGRTTALIHPVSAKERGIQDIFLPNYTTLDCATTFASGDGSPLLYTEVMKECCAPIRLTDKVEYLHAE